MIFESGINTYPPLDNTDTLFVSSKEILQNRVFVLGEVGRPGVIEFNNQITLLEAISKAGGVTKDAVTSKIFIARGDLNAPEVIEVNLDEILQEGKISNNIVLENGDALYISRKFLSGLKEFMEAIMPLVRLVESFYIISNL
jgi:polysaccharide export outer membrane protein